MRTRSSPPTSTPTATPISTGLALGDAAAWPVQSFLKHYHHEFEYMVRNKGRSIVDAEPGEAA